MRAAAGGEASESKRSPRAERGQRRALRFQGALSYAVLLVLGIIVLIRTFLSWSLALELDGRWPWQRGSERALS